VTALAIDTATEACSAALLHQGRLYRRFELAPRQHAQLILPMIDSLLEEADCGRDKIEWIAFGRGPGAFTGVRIAAGIAHGLALGLNCGLLPVSTLAALAFRAHEQHGAAQVMACLDARMGEVYWGCYQLQDGIPQPLGREIVCSPERVTGEKIEVSSAWGVGPGWAVYPEQLELALGGLPAHTETDYFPDAAAMLEIARRQLDSGARTLAPADAQPIYLRDNVAVPSSPREPPVNG